MPERMADLAVIGLSTMGQNLALNIEGKGFSVAVYNRTSDVTKDFIQAKAKGKNIFPAYSLQKLTTLLTKPRNILLLVKAGEPVDEVIRKLIPNLQKNDLIIDGGNSHFQDSERRQIFLKKRGFLFLGMGVSGGKEGALNGPSMMPGGDKRGYNRVQKILNKTAAQKNGYPCCDYLGPRGAGHFVKMIHNGIEYAIMGAIAESYDYLRKVFQWEPEKISQAFAQYQNGELDSYLVQITAEVLSRKDSESHEPLINLVSDQVSQKGTGKWTVQTALDLGVPTPSISAAVEERNLSFIKNYRVQLNKIYKNHSSNNKSLAIGDLFQALGASTIMAYTQGFHLLKVGSDEYNYRLDLETIARVWQGGCIIRSELLPDIVKVFHRQPKLTNLLASLPISRKIKTYQSGWQRTITSFVQNQIPCSVLAASLNYFYTITDQSLPANLLALLRDRFGAHGFARKDKKGQFYVPW